MSKDGSLQISSAVRATLPWCFGFSEKPQGAQMLFGGFALSHHED